MKKFNPFLILLFFLIACVLCPVASAIEQSYSIGSDVVVQDNLDSPSFSLSDVAAVVYESVAKYHLNDI